MRDFRKLKVWEKSHLLTLKVYTVTETYPKREDFRLVSQMQRSSSSIPTNIAEGCGRDSEAELARFMQISMGSASELEYQFILSRDLDYIDSIKYLELNNAVVEVKKMLARFIKTLRK